MPCERFQPALTNAALGGPADAAFEAHLRACARCRRRLADRRAAIDAVDRELATALSVAPSAGFEAGIRARLGGMPAKRTPWRRWAAPAAAAAGIAVAAALLQQPRSAADLPSAAENAALHTPLKGRGPDRAIDRRPADPMVQPRPHVRTHARAVYPNAGDHPLEVLVPPGSAEAIRRLVVAVAEGRVAAVSGQTTPDGTAGASSPIAPVSVPPIPLSTVEVRETAVSPIDETREGVHRD